MSASVDPLLPLIEPGWKGVEVGVKEGHSSEALFRHGVRFLWLVDPWEKYGGYQEAADDPDGYWEGVYGTAMDRLSPWAGKHSTLRMMSDKAVRFIPPGADFVWIDGNHEYDYAKADIENYWPLIRPGGLLCGDDYCDNGPGSTCRVKAAVDEFVRGMGLGLELRLPCWAVRKP